MESQKKETPNVQANRPYSEEFTAPDVADQVEYFYINNTQFSGSNWDIRLVFSETLPSGKIRPRVGVVMSYQHAKALAETLAVNIAGLENVMGEIIYKPLKPNLPPPQKKTDLQKPTRKVSLEEEG